MTVAGRALVCSYYVPQHDLDSASRRMRHLIEFLLESGWDVTVAARTPDRSARGTRALGRQGVRVVTPIGPQLRELIADEPFDLALLGFWHVAEPLVNLLRRASPETRIVVDSMDLHFVRHARRVFNRVIGSGSALDDAYAAETIRELNTYAAADGVLAVSRKEADLINDLTADPGLAHAVPDCEDLALSPVPFARRSGLLFIGNFEHPPNVDAVRYLCEHVLPLVEPALLAEHPLTIVGNEAERLLDLPAAGLPGVRIVGWVPSVIPYLDHARVSLIPLLYGAGTKRKLIQSLMVGTPSVSTTVGIEGLDLRDGEQVLVADDPGTFAAALSALLVDEPLWRRLRRRGRRHVLARRGREHARARLLEALDAVLERPAKEAGLDVPDWVVERTRLPPDSYAVLVRRIQRTVRRSLPPEATVLVVSRGDPRLVELDAREAWHFPRDEYTGGYAGYHPADSGAALEELEGLRKRGAEFLLLPSTSFWWLEEYGELARHLERRFQPLVRDETCAIFDLRTPAFELPPSAPVASISHNGRLLLSVIVPTRNRAELLEASLDSLVDQSLAQEHYEVVVVDDGSTDETAEVCERLAARLPLRYQRIPPSGIAAAKNAGVLAASGSLLCFFDDDDVADRNLLLEHARGHELHTGWEFAILGHTRWSPALLVTEVMRFVTDVGHYLFAYDGLDGGEELDFTYFWGGRTSCKRSFLQRHGLFTPDFTFGSEDIELGYRLSKHGLRVVYWPTALQLMNRPLTYAEFCRRCERQGRSQWLFSRMHPEPEVAAWCGTVDAEESWAALAAGLAIDQSRVAELERELPTLGGTRAQRAARDELWRLYWRTFDACKLKGIVDAMRADEGAAVATA